ncbi:MAG: glycerol-3-phosphate dehydrogenase/oxidase [Alphaproteobacteria bacterium]|nr:glycerol-3-phosphate dehydrogenase/oxidase [Alphaproteobacteria bacterium]
MRRNLERLSNDTFDLLVIGGGITGACVARDAARRGLKVALIDKGDFANATSAHNSKLIHGGLRYLRNFELGLVRESLRERRIWQRTAPHLVHPLPFLVPVQDHWATRATLRAGLTLYDLLSYDRGWLDDPDQRLPGYRWLNRKAALSRDAILDQPGLSGAFRYFDAQMYAPERLALECLIDARAHDAVIANYAEAKALIIHNGRVTGAAVEDRMGSGAFTIQARVTLVATGPWSDIFLDRALGRKTAHRILRSKGIHLIVPAMTRGDALTVAANGGHFFLLPWRGHTLLGTTDTAFTGDPDHVRATEQDIADFLSFINTHLPAAQLRREQVEHAYAGLRPLVDDGSGNTYGASRRAELIDHRGDGVEALFSAIGGKWTTSRALAESIVDTIVRVLHVKTQHCTTANAALPGGNIPRIRDFAAEQSRTHSDLSGIGHLWQMYGTRLREMLSVAADRPELLTPLSPSGDIGAQILFAVREEMALTLGDVILRRTGIGQLGAPSPTVLETVSRLMAEELGWTELHRRNQIEAVKSEFANGNPA